MGGLLLLVLPSVAVAESPAEIRRLVALMTTGALLGGALAMCLPVRGNLRIALMAPAALVCAYLFVWILLVATNVSHGARMVALEQVPLAALALALGVMLFAFGARLEISEAHRPASVAAFVIAACGLVPVAYVLSSGTATAWLPDAFAVWVPGATALIVASVGAALLVDSGVGRIVRRGVERVETLPSRAFVTIGAVLALALAIFVAAWVFGLRPRSSDEIAQLWHARILTHGRLALPTDANPEFFAVDNVVDRGGWYSQFPIGGPLILAVGVLTHLAWLVNPVLLALAVVHLHGFARVAYGERFARWAALLFVLAPLVLLMSGTYMNHVPALWLTCLALHSYARWSTSDDLPDIRRAAALLGAAVAGLATVRPYDALIVALVIGVAQLRVISLHAERRRSLLVQLVAGIPFVLFVFWANWRTTGNPLRFGYDVMYGAGHSPGFHIDPYGQPFTPLRGFVYATSYLFQLNLLLFEWAMPALAIVVCALFFVRRSDGRGRWDMLLVALLITQVVAYGMYWHNGEFLGPRFLFSVTPAVVLLAARAPMLAAMRWKGTMRRTWLALLPLATLGAWLPLPITSGAIARLRYYRAQQKHYAPDPFALAARDTAARLLVFVDVGITQRTARRLWALGVPRAAATTLISRGNACTLIPAIELEETRAADTTGRVQRLRLAAARNTTDTTTSRLCQERVQRERGAALDYGTFLLRNEIGGDGHLTGRIIWAADLGDRNEELRTRFADRKWYRLTGTVQGTVTHLSLRPY